MAWPPESAFALVAAATFGVAWAEFASHAAPLAHLRMLLFLAATAALPTAAAAGGQHRHCRRRLLLAVHRIAAFGLLPEELLSLPQLAFPPRSWALDISRILLCSRALRLLVFGVGAPLDLPLHLLVHTACLALVLGRMPSACTQPLLANSTMERRFDLFHSVMAAPFIGILPPGYPPGGDSVHCTATMAFVACLLGWLLPTFLVVKSHSQRLHARLQRAQHDGDRVGGGSGAGRDAVGGGGLGRRSGDLPQAPPCAGWCPAIADRAAEVCAEWLFLEGAPAEFQMQAWVCLTAFVWLGCTLFALAGAHAGLPSPGPDASAWHSGR
ncbi:hypothetical protein ABPG75_013943 [Micractinium tetrahymenae]